MLKWEYQYHIAAYNYFTGNFMSLLQNLAYILHKNHMGYEVVFDWQDRVLIASSHIPMHVVFIGVHF